MFTRIYTGDDGQTHFEDLDLPGERAIHSGMQITPGVNFRKFEPGYFSDWHTAPRRQYVITLAGEMEVGIGDGTKRRFGAGDVLMADDLTGAGPYYRRSRRPAPRVQSRYLLPSGRPGCRPATELPTGAVPTRARQGRCSHSGAFALIICRAVAKRSVPPSRGAMIGSVMPASRYSCNRSRRSPAPAGRDILRIRVCSH